MASRRLKKKQESPACSDLYASKIIVGGALLDDTKTLLSHWDQEATVQENIDRIRRENIFGKASRSRVEKILPRLRARYLCEEQVTRALIALVKHRLPAASLDRILYFHTAKADRLLSDVVIKVLAPLKAQGTIDVSVTDVERALTKWNEQGKTTSSWGEYTIRRVAQGALSTLRDFGVLSGSVTKRIAPTYLPIEAFVYVMFFLKQHQPSGAKLLDLPDWNLFFLPHEGVERFLFEAHQLHLLEYHAAGSVTRLTFPVETLEEYAHVLAQRTH